MKASYYLVGKGHCCVVMPASSRDNQACMCGCWDWGQCLFLSCLERRRALGSAQVSDSELYPILYFKNISNDFIMHYFKSGLGVMSLFLSRPLSKAWQELSLPLTILWVWLEKWPAQNWQVFIFLNSWLLYSLYSSWFFFVSSYLSC